MEQRPSHSQSRLAPGPATGQRQIPHPPPNPPHLRLHAAVTRREPPLDRQPNGPQGLGYDQKGLWTMDSYLYLLNNKTNPNTTYLYGAINDFINHHKIPI